MRIVSYNRIYESLQSSSFPENSYVESILKVAPDLFPGYHCVRFSPKVESEYGNHEPDLVLVDHRYREWIVVEAELEHHSLTSHVEPQVRCFAYGRYDESHVQAIARGLPEVDAGRLRILIANLQPRVMVIVPQMKDRWKSVLSNYNAILTIFEIFEDTAGNRLFRVNGDVLRNLDEEIIGIAKRIPSLRNGLELVGIQLSEETMEIPLMLDDQLTRWRVVRSSQHLMLFPTGRCPLPDHSLESYTVRKSSDEIWRLVLDEH